MLSPGFQFVILPPFLRVCSILIHTKCNLCPWHYYGSCFMVHVYIAIHSCHDFNGGSKSIVLYFCVSLTYLTPIQVVLIVRPLLEGSKHRMVGKGGFQMFSTPSCTISCPTILKLDAISIELRFETTFHILSHSREV